MKNQQKLKGAMNLQSRFFDSNGNLMDITDLHDCIESGWYMEIANYLEGTVHRRICRTELYYRPPFERPSRRSALLLYPRTKNGGLSKIYLSGGTQK